MTLRISGKTNFKGQTVIKQPLSSYSVSSLYEPKLVSDFAGVNNSGIEYYRSSGSVNTFNSLFKFCGSSDNTRDSNATMVDSDGKLKWAPHNLVEYSENFDPITTSWSTTNTTALGSRVTADAGTFAAYFEQGVSSRPIAQYTITVIFPAIVGRHRYVWVADRGVVPLASATFDLDGVSVVGQNVGVTPTITSLPDGSVSCTIEYSRSSVGTTGVNIALAGSSHTSDRPILTWVGSEFIEAKVSFHRSDLGGMVDNPDRGDSYVPTTSSVRYLARRNHHTWDGSSWVNSGILLETEARENLQKYSNDFATGWSTSHNITQDTTGIDGNTSAWTLSDSGVGGTGTVSIVSGATTVPTSSTLTFSIYAERNGGVDYIAIRTLNFTTPPADYTYFNLSAGVVVSEGIGHTGSINEVAPGVYRCSITFTTDASDTTGQMGIYLSQNGTNTTVDLDNTSSVVIQNAQLERNPITPYHAYTPSSYIPTAVDTGTRSTESLQIAAADMPWPTPNVIGQNLVTNGTFDTDTDWTKGTGWAIAGGVASFFGGTGADLTQTGLNVEANKAYQISFDMTQISGSGFRVVVDTSGSFVSQYFTTTAQHTVVFAVGATSTRLRLSALGGANFSIDNFSVREIDPLSVSLQMQGKITYADEDTSLTHIFNRWHLDPSNEIRNSIWTNSTNTGGVTFEQRVSGTLNRIGEIPPGSYSPDILVPYNIASRHGSTFINGAINGTALTADTTPTALPDLSATDFSLGYDYMGTIAQFRVWDKDITNTGIEEASQ